MSQNVIFISEQLFKERTGASNQIDARQIVPLIKVAQDMHIQPALGSTLYIRLQNGITANNLVARETNLLDNYITDALIWFTMASLPMTIGFQLFAKGFLQKSAEETVTPDRADLELIEQKYTSIAEFYKTRLVRYLQENETLFPEYLNFTQAIDTITPDQNAYTCPIYLGNSMPTTESLQYVIGSGGNGSGGNYISVNPTNKFVPFNDNGVFDDSHLINDPATNSLKTKNGGDFDGFDFDFTGEVYKIGKGYNTGVMTLEFNYSTGVIESKAGGNSNGIKLDFSTNLFRLGDLGADNYFEANNGLLNMYQGGSKLFEIDGNGIVTLGDPGGSSFFGVDTLGDTLRGGINLITTSAGNNSGFHLKINIGGNDYVIELRNA